MAPTKANEAKATASLLWNLFKFYLPFQSYHSQFYGMRTGPTPGLAQKYLNGY